MTNKHIRVYFGRFLMVGGILLLTSFTELNKANNASVKEKKELLNYKEKTTKVALPNTFEKLMNEKVYKKLRDEIYLESKIWVESRGDSVAVSYDNCNGIGILQITPVMIRECNAVLKRKGIDKTYTLEDRKRPHKSLEIYKIVQSHYNPHFDLLSASSLWNGGKRDFNQLSPKAKKMVGVYHERILKRMRVVYTQKKNGYDQRRFRVVSERGVRDNPAKEW